MYQPLPSAAELAASGLTLADFEDDDFEVWPENWPVVQVFRDLWTQWQVGGGGAVGLRYESLYPLLDRRFPQAVDWDQAFSDVQAMESAALVAMRG